MHGFFRRQDVVKSDDAMNPDMTPEEEDNAADHYREQLKQLAELPPPTDPGDVRKRRSQKEELERSLREYDLGTFAYCNRTKYFGPSANYNTFLEGGVTFTFVP